MADCSCLIGYGEVMGRYLVMVAGILCIAWITVEAIKRRVPYFGRLPPPGVRGGG
jgi:hypothetical protein